MVLRLLREETVEALLARLRLLRGRPCSMENQFWCPGDRICHHLFLCLSEWSP